MLTWCACGATVSAAGPSHACAPPQASGRECECTSIGAAPPGAGEAESRRLQEHGATLVVRLQAAREEIARLRAENAWLRASHGGGE